jgi:hypothetical protein
MKGCENCGRDMSHRIKPGPGRPPAYCDQLACNRLRAAKRKRDERHRRIQHNPKRLGRVPRGHYYLPGPTLRKSEDVGRIDWDCFHVDREEPVNLAHEHRALSHWDRRRVEELDAQVDRWLERGGAE